MIVSPNKSIVLDFPTSLEESVCARWKELGFDDEAPKVTHFESSETPQHG